MVCLWGPSQVNWSGSKIILVLRSPSLPTIPPCFQRGTEAGEEEEGKPSAACLNAGSREWGPCVCGLLQKHWEPQLRTEGAKGSGKTDDWRVGKAFLSEYNREKCLNIFSPSLLSLMSIKKPSSVPYQKKTRHVCTAGRDGESTTLMLEHVRGHQDGHEKNGTSWKPCCSRHVFSSMNSLPRADKQREKKKERRKRKLLFVYWQSCS